MTKQFEREEIKQEVKVQKVTPLDRLSNLRSKHKEKAYLNKNVRRIGDKGSVTTTLSDKDYKLANKLYNTMKSATRYPMYKVAFIKFCKIVKIPNNNVTIKSVKFSGNNTVSINFIQNNNKVIVPAGSNLYHISPVGNMHQLDPKFRSSKGYFFDKPRVYLTLKKNMPKISADMGAGNKKFVYEPCEKIGVAYSDPLLPSINGAVYVQTSFPIMVRNLTKRRELRKKDDDYKVDDYKVKDYATESFMDDYILINDEYYDEYMVESIKSKIGEVTRKHDSKKFFAKVWNKINSGITHKCAHRDMDDKEYQTFTKLFDKMTNTQNYNEYKLIRQKICKMFGLGNNDLVIARFRTEESKDKPGYKHVAVDYEEGRVRIVIPNGEILMHKTPIKGIRSLVPSFRSRSKGRYLYPRKRVYFTVGKEISDWKMGVDKGTKVYKLTPVTPIKTAFIDPAIKDYKAGGTGAVYVDSDVPIPVKEINPEKNQQPQNKPEEKKKPEVTNNSNEPVKESVSSVDVIDYMNTIVTNAFYEGVITEPEYVLFVDLLNK